MIENIIKHEISQKSRKGMRLLASPESHMGLSNEVANAAFFDSLKNHGFLAHKSKAFIETLR
jgi:hypothetical protein